MKDREHKTRRRIIIGISLIAICVIAVFVLGDLLEATRKDAEPKGDITTRFTPTPTIEYKGAQYSPRTNMTTILVLGTDHYADENGQENSYRNGGQADFIIVLVIDNDRGTITPIQIDRDTIAKVTILGVLGNETGTRDTQICLAHGFGDGRDWSCQLQRDAVSRLMYGIDIPYYVSLSLDGISKLNDSVGGVTVTIRDDFSSLDPTMQVGSTITLKGVQAEYFVRNREDIGVGSNQERGLRQTEYWEKLVDLLDQQLRTQDDTDFIHILLDQIDPFLTTNLKQGKIINEIWKDREYSRREIIHPEGTYSYGEDGFVEFHIDQDTWKDMLMGLYYQKIG